MPASKCRFQLSYLPLLFVLISVVSMALLLLSGGMRKVVAWNLLPLIVPLTGLASLIFAVLRLVVRMLRRQRIDRITIASGIIGFLALLPAVQMFIPLVAYPAALSQMRPAATVRLPAEVPLKVLWGGDTLAVNYHAYVPDQRWAYDLAVAPYLTGSDQLTDYGCYGVTVVAPAAGVVTVAHDGEPDAIPGKASNNSKQPTGNHVAIRMDATGTYLEIAHLKPGSVAVRVGEHVAEGQPVGQCGNSGNTSEPHIHIHHQRLDPAVYPLNFAEGLPLYFQDLEGLAMPQGGIKEVNGELVGTGDTVTPRK